MKRDVAPINFREWKVAHPGSWWADPTVQRDRDAFRVAQRAQEGRWLAEQQRIGKLMAGIATDGWMVNGGKRKGMLGSISAGAL